MDIDVKEDKSCRGDDKNNDGHEAREDDGDGLSSAILFNCPNFRRLCPQVRIFRSSRPDLLTNEGTEYLRDHLNIKTIIDMRSVAEYKQATGDKLTANYYNIYQLKFPQQRIYKRQETVKGEPVERHNVCRSVSSPSGSPRSPATTSNTHSRASSTTTTTTTTPPTTPTQTTPSSSLSPSFGSSRQQQQQRQYGQMPTPSASSPSLSTLSGSPSSLLPQPPQKTPSSRRPGLSADADAETGGAPGSASRDDHLDDNRHDDKGSRRDGLLDENPAVADDDTPAVADDNHPAADTPAVADDNHPAAAVIDNENGNGDSEERQHYLMDIFKSYHWLVLRRAPWYIRLYSVFLFLYDMVFRTGFKNFMRLYVRNVMNPQGILGQYKDMIEIGSTQICAALKLLSCPERVPALLNCTFGKDRTGVLSALILACLGKDKEYIANNYAESAVLLEKEVLRSEMTAKYQLDDVFITAKKETMMDLLDFIEEKYGSVSDYLEHIGFSKEEQKILCVNISG